MPPENYFNISSKQLGRSIYRVLSFDQMVEMFTSLHNTLRRPHTWKDPFENLIRSTPVRRANGELGNFGFADDVYGQCWTLHKASDAMWSIYSKDQRHVRIRTTIKRLAESLSGTLGDWASSECFIGRVNYLTDEELRKFIETVFKDQISIELVAKTYFVKRNAFRHEKEIRLLHIKKDHTADDSFQYPIDPHSLIDQIMVHPLLPKSDVANFKSEIVRATKYKGEIKRSLLYKLPNDLVFETRSGFQDHASPKPGFRLSLR